MVIGQCLFLEFICQEKREGSRIIGGERAVRDVIKTMRALLTVDGSSCCAQPVVCCSFSPSCRCVNTRGFVYFDARVLSGLFLVQAVFVYFTSALIVPRLVLSKHDACAFWGVSLMKRH